MPICPKCGSYSVRSPCPDCSRKEGEDIIAQEVPPPVKEWGVRSSRDKKGSSALLREDRTAQLERELKSRNDHIRELEQKLRSGELDVQIAKLGESVKKKDSRLLELEKNVVTRDNQVAELEKKIIGLEESLAEKNTKISELVGETSKIEVLREKLASAANELSRKDKVLSGLDKGNLDLRERVKKLEQILEEKERHLSKLGEEMEDLRTKNQASEQH